MPGLRIAIILASLFLQVSVSSAEDGAAASKEPKAAVVKLCSALEAIQPGDRLRVVVTGVYNRHRRLWDPHDPNCRRNVQPVTLLQLAPGFNEPSQAVELLEKEGKVLGTFTGTLLGPPRPNPDVPSEHPNSAYVLRIGKFMDYSNSFRTTLIVDDLAGIWSALESGSPSWHEPANSPFPVVLRSALPVAYPWKAKVVYAQGDVVVQIEVKSGKVISTTVISAADRLLIEDTLANIKTWEFEPDVEATFTTTFTYRFEDLPSTTASVRVHAELPVRVEIIAPRSDW